MSVFARFQAGKLLIFSFFPTPSPIFYGRPSAAGFSPCEKGTKQGDDFLHISPRGSVPRPRFRRRQAPARIPTADREKAQQKSATEKRLRRKWHGKNASEKNAAKKAQQESSTSGRTLYLPDAAADKEHKMQPELTGARSNRPIFIVFQAINRPSLLTIARS